jgi:hypothetical protein
MNAGQCYNIAMSLRCERLLTDNLLEALKPLGMEQIHDQLFRCMPMLANGICLNPNTNKATSGSN